MFLGKVQSRSLRKSMKNTTPLLLVLFAGTLLQPVLAGTPVNQILVTTTADGLDNTDGACSLREAIRNANNNTAFSLLVGECRAGSASLTDEIVLTGAQLYALTAAGEGDNVGDLDVHGNGLDLDLRIVSSGNDRAVIQQNIANQRILQIHGATIEIEGVLIRNGGLDGPGGGIFNDAGHLTLRDSELFNNSANAGGGLYNTGFLRMEGVLLQNNSAGFIGGGGIFNVTPENASAPARLEVVGSIFESNTATSGGGIYNSGGEVDIRGSDFEGNIASASGGSGGEGGGAMFSTSQFSTRILDSRFEFNQSESSGGAIAKGNTSGGSRTFVTRSHFTNNEASSEGGAIYSRISSGSLEARHSSFVDNVAAGPGGAVSVAAFADFFDSELRGNRSTGNRGGAIDADAVLIERSQLTGNQAGGIGGAVQALEVRVRDSQFSGNSAGTHGGAIRASTLVDIRDSRFFDNAANGDGGAVLGGPTSIFGQSTVVRSLFFNNQAGGNGGGIWINHYLDLANSTISGNKAGGGGGLFISETGAVAATHVTLSQNFIGQDVHKLGTLWLRGSLIGTEGQTSCTMALNDPTIISFGHNLSADVGCFGLNEVSDQYVSDLMLDTLADNGGNTWTHALLPGSPALDAGEADCGDIFAMDGVDQRRAPRSFGAACDIGAHEQGAEPPALLFSNGFESP